MARRNEFDQRLNDIVNEHVDLLVGAISKVVRDNIADELKDYLSGGNGIGRLGRRRLFGEPRKRRIVGCIAPGCTTVSKGPRFHYLCEKHMDAPRKDYETWRKQQKQARQLTA